MSPLEGPRQELDEKYVNLIVKFVSDVRNGRVEGSCAIALATVSLLEQIIGEAQHATASELLGVVRGAGALVTRALPTHLVAANMVRRVLRALRDERRLQDNQSGESAGENLQRLVLAAPRAPTSPPPTPPAHRDLREPLREHIAELRLELESSASGIAGMAREHVHAEELLLTCGGGGGASALVERFLRAAAPRHYRLLVAEGSTPARAHRMAARLASALPVTVLSNAAVYGVMSRVNKVVVGVRAALAGGALLAPPGLHALTLAAKHHSVPVIALAPLYKLCPLHSSDQHQRSAPAAAPHHALQYQSSECGAAHVYAPLYDYVPPDHVTLFITNLGGSSPSYIYRLLSELYDPRDYQL